MKKQVTTANKVFDLIRNYRPHDPMSPIIDSLQIILNQDRRDRTKNLSKLTDLCMDDEFCMSLLSIALNRAGHNPSFNGRYFSTFMLPLVLNIPRSTMLLLGRTPMVNSGLLDQSLKNIQHPDGKSMQFYFYPQLLAPPYLDQISPAETYDMLWSLKEMEIRHGMTSWPQSVIEFGANPRLMEPILADNGDFIYPLTLLGAVSCSDKSKIESFFSDNEEGTFGFEAYEAIHSALHLNICGPYPEISIDYLNQFYSVREGLITTYAATIKSLIDDILDTVPEYTDLSLFYEAKKGYAEVYITLFNHSIRRMQTFTVIIPESLDRETVEVGVGDIAEYNELEFTVLQNPPASVVRKKAKVINLFDQKQVKETAL